MGLDQGEARFLAVRSKATYIHAYITRRTRNGMENAHVLSDSRKRWKKIIIRDINSTRRSPLSVILLVESVPRWFSGVYHRNRTRKVGY